jgi:hypothetical protein
VKSEEAEKRRARGRGGRRGRKADPKGTISQTNRLGLLTLTNGLGSDGLANLTLLENVRGLDIVPLLLGEGVHAGGTKHCVKVQLKKDRYKNNHTDG